MQRAQYVFHKVHMKTFRWAPIIPYCPKLIQYNLLSYLLSVSYLVAVSQRQHSFLMETSQYMDDKSVGENNEEKNRDD